MAQCKTCGREVAYNAKTCPDCGRQLPTQQIVAVITGVVLLGLLIAVST